MTNAIASLKLGSALAVGTEAWDESKGSGPQDTGLVEVEVAQIVFVSKTRVVQAEIDFKVVSPAARVNETFKTWENVHAKVDDAKTVKSCTGNLVKLLGSAYDGVVDDNGRLLKEIPAGFDLANLKGQRMFVYTIPGEGNKQPQISVLTRPQANKVEAGEIQIPDRRQVKQAKSAAGFGLGGASGAGLGDDPFGTNAATPAPSQPANNMGASSTNPFA